MCTLVYLMQLVRYYEAISKRLPFFSLLKRHHQNSQEAERMTYFHKAQAHKALVYFDPRTFFVLLIVFLLHIIYTKVR